MSGGGRAEEDDDRDTTRVCEPYWDIFQLKEREAWKEEEELPPTWRCWSTKVPLTCSCSVTPPAAAAAAGNRAVTCDERRVGECL